MRRKAIIIGMVGVLMFSLLGCGNTVDVKNQKLIGYRNAVGGGMTGGGRSEELSVIQGEVYLTCSQKEWWSQDNKITEYKLDKAVLEEIEAVFRKYRMNGWNNKEFSKMFISDGESESYYFQFDNKESVRFSSQIYPPEYSKKLSELDTVIAKYKESAVLEPGLAVQEKTEEESLYKNHPDNGKVELEVYEYSKDRLYYRVMNGTEEAVDVPTDVQLIGAADNMVICKGQDTYSTNVRAGFSEEKTLRLPGRLQEGTYVLQVGEYSVQFEIK